MSCAQMVNDEVVVVMRILCVCGYEIISEVTYC